MTPKILGTIGESIGPGSQLRRAVRVVLFDKDQNIALGFYPPKSGYPNGEYTLPGGGVEAGESVTAALVRECLEEVGCHLKNIKELGLIKESGVGKDTKHDQDTYCFIAEIEGEKGRPQYTEREKEDRYEIKWLPLDEALTEIANQEMSSSRSRSLICLKEVKVLLNA